MAAGGYDSVTISWKDVSCTVPSSAKSTVLVKVLKHVSGSIDAGKLTAIMGQSGAGKTTMMDLVAGRLHQNGKFSISGDIYVNGELVDWPRFRRVTAYVQQLSHLPITESVRECLMFSAQLRLPESLSEADRSARVDAIIDELGLRDCENTLIGSQQFGIKGVSGGEMRRVSVGMELVTSPVCLFLDEPTSGLDSEIAMSLTRTLKTIAAHGRTVAMTIHQPNSDITEQFDNLMLLAKGEVMYGGPWRDAIQAFAEAGFPCPQFKNPTDFFMRVVADEENIPKLAAYQKERLGLQPDGEADDTAPVEVKVDGEPATGFAVVDANTQGTSSSVLRQISQLCKRQVRTWIRHPVALIGEGVQYILLSFFIGGMYWQLTTDDAQEGAFGRASSSFYFMAVVGFIPTFTAITVWQGERHLVGKDVRQNLYSLLTFFLAKTTIMVPVELAFGAVASVVSYFMFGYQRNFGKFLVFYICMVGTLFASESFGLMFAMAFNNNELAIVAASLILIVFLSLTGFLTTSLPAFYKWVQYLNYLRYSNSAVFQNEMQGLVLGPDDDQVKGEDLLTGALQTLDTGLPLWANVAVLLGMLVFFRIMAFGFLKCAYHFNWM